MTQDLINYTDGGGAALGRWCELHQEREETVLRPDDDMRHPRFRREVFLRFYEFHLLHRTHPGCVYFAFDWLERRYSLNPEQMLWLAFINGNTQNIITSWIIFKECPDFARVTGMGLSNFFTENYHRLAFDNDRRYHKKDFLRAVESYRSATKGDQVEFFKRFTDDHEPKRAFDELWKAVRKGFYTFGRLSAFSYTEYLRLVGVSIECPTLFLHDMDGSRSHRNGLARVLGRDDLDWHASTGFEGKYAPGQVEWLELEGEQLLAEARERTAREAVINQDHVHYHTMESAFCTFKSWFRPNRRYPNVYADMMRDRILLAEKTWGPEAVSHFWKMRKDCLPPNLRVEDCPHDPGVAKKKQNHFRETGQPIMMSQRWPELDNAFDRECWA